MPSRLWFQFQDITFPLWTHAHVHESRTAGVKLLQPHRCPAQPFGPGIEYMGRVVFPNDVDKSLINRPDVKTAAREFVYDWMRPIIVKCPWITIWCGHNEVDTTSEEACRRFRAYEPWRIKYMRQLLRELSGSYANAQTMASSFGTGNPRFLEYWRWVAPAINAADYAELHEYGMRRMDIAGWHLGRCEKARDAAKCYGYELPKMIIGETGIDYFGDPKNDGWRERHGLGGISSDEYVRQLIAYDMWCQQHDWIVGVAPFIWRSTGWPSFDIDEHTSSLLVARMRAQGMDIERLIAAAGQKIVLPLNPHAAFEIAAARRSYMAASPEGRIDIGGVRYAYQGFRHPANRQWQNWVYTIEGDWDPSHFHWFKARN